MAVLIFVVSSMVAMGLGLTVREIVAPLRNARLLILSLLANFVLMPLVAVGLARVLRLDEPLGVGLLLLGAAAGAPFLPLLAQMAKGNLAFAVGLMVLELVVTVGYLPIALPLMIPGVAVSPVRIAGSLFLVMLLPLGIAMAVRARYVERRSASETDTRSGFQPVPHTDGVAHYRGEYQQCSGVLRNLRHLRRPAFYRDWLLHRVVAWRATRGNAARTGTRHGITQLRGGAGRRRSKFQRPRGRRYGGRRRNP